MKPLLFSVSANLLAVPGSAPPLNTLTVIEIAFGEGVGGVAGVNDGDLVGMGVGDDRWGDGEIKKRLGFLVGVGTGDFVGFLVRFENQLDNRPGRDMKK